MRKTVSPLDSRNEWRTLLKINWKRIRQEKNTRRKNMVRLAIELGGYALINQARLLSPQIPKNRNQTLRDFLFSRIEADELGTLEDVTVHAITEVIDFCRGA